MVYLFNDNDRTIEVDYEIDSTHHVVGEAYFKQDDLLAPIEKGVFRHPMTEQEYQLLTPPRGLQDRWEPELRKLEWRLVRPVK